MQIGIQKVVDEIERQVRIGHWQAERVAGIRDDVSTIAAAVSDGRLVMRSTRGGDEFWFASNGLRIIAGTLARTAPGRAILIYLGKLTLKETLDTAKLPYAWTAPPAQHVQKAAQTGRKDRELDPKGKDGAGR